MERFPAPLRHVLVSRPVASAAAARTRAALVRPSVPFLLRELLAVRGPAAYRLKESGLPIVLEHRTPDVLVLDEVFNQRIYDPPPPVAELLAQHPRLRVLDVGANIGTFGLWLLGRRPHARITAVEPDARNAAVHRRLIERNGNSARWQLIEAAAAAHEGTVAFTAGDFVTSRMVGDAGAASADDAGPIEVAAIDLLPMLPAVDLLKLDAEGAEWAILLDERFGDAPPPLLALEYHPHLCPGGDARETALARLNALGYQVCEVKTTAPPGNGSVWAWLA